MSTRYSVLLLLLLAAFLLPLRDAAGQQRLKIACVGDSITYGSGLPDRERTTYPLVLGHLLGDGYEVRNFGVSGATMLAQGDKPWLETAAAEEALAWSPDVVVIKLGTNDSKRVNWHEHGGECEADARVLIGRFRKTAPEARILLCAPVPAWSEGDGIDRGRVADGVVPALHRAAAATGVELIDLYTPFQNRKGWFPTAFTQTRTARKRSRAASPKPS